MGQCYGEVLRGSFMRQCYGAVLWRSVKGNVMGQFYETERDVIREY